MHSKYHTQRPTIYWQILNSGYEYLFSLAGTKVRKSSFKEGQGSSTEKYHEPSKANVGYQTGAKCKNKT